MKKLFLLGAMLFVGSLALNAQTPTVDEIIDTYFENIGSVEGWNKVENMRITGVGRQQGVDYPFVATYMKDGRYIIDVDLQGTSFVVEAFDGENSWAMNFQTQQAEASDSETSANTKARSLDQIAGPFHNYNDKGYTVELVGEDTYEGTAVYKVKVTLTPQMVDGKEEEDVDIYYFDTENFVPLATENIVTSGPAKGATAVTVFSDYQETDGLYMAYSQENKFNGQTQLLMLVNTVEFNVEVDESIFKMPED